MGKQISLIFRPKLLAGNAEWRTGNAASQQIYFSAIRFSVKLSYVLPTDIPIRPIITEYVAVILFNFHHHCMLKTSIFEA